jgi:hypothetical protein
MKAKKTDDELELVEPSWSTQIAKKFKGAVPIVTDIPKGKSSCSIHYRSDSDIMEIAEKIVYKRTGKFSSPSEVFRAAMHIGISMIWSLYDETGEKSPFGKAMFERMQQREELVNASIAIREFLRDVDAIYKAAEDDIISFDERDTKVNKIISSLPTNLRDVARERLRRYEAGEKVSQIHDFRTHGGVRK